MSDEPEREDAAEPSAEAEAADAADPQARIAELEAQLSEANERILRLAADVENTRRIGAREKADAAKYAISGLAGDMINVADIFERALQAIPEESEAGSTELKNLIVGVRMTEKSLLSTLERHGVKRIAPKGERFDPNLHQAIAETPSDLPKGHVVEVAQAGYVIGDRVLRAPMVTVSSGPAAGGAPADQPPADAGSSEPGERVDRTV